MAVQKKNWRKVWLDAHLYIGLTIGLIFALIGLTGSVNVFQYEIDELLNPELTVPAQAPDQPQLDAVMASVRAAYPDHDGSWRLVMGRKSSTAIRIEYEKAEPASPQETPLWVQLDVDPNSGEIVRTYFWSQTLVTWIHRFHASFLAGDPGYTFVSIMGLVLLVSGFSGLYLWWPRGGKFRRSLTIKRGASRERFIFDLHQVGGIYSLVLLIILAISGINIIYPQYIGAIVNMVSPVQESGLLQESEDQGAEQILRSAPADGRPRISMAAAVAAARQVFPGAELRVINTPSGVDGVYVIRLRPASEKLNKSWPQSTVWIDQYSGAPLHVRNPKNFSRGETFVSVLGSLHSGEAFGLPSRILVFLSGFTLAGLYVTGVMRWLDKRKAQKFRRTRTGDVARGNA